MEAKANADPGQPVPAPAQNARCVLPEPPCVGGPGPDETHTRRETDGAFAARGQGSVHPSFHRRPRRTFFPLFRSKRGLLCAQLPELRRAARAQYDPKARVQLHAADCRRRPFAAQSLPP